MVPLHVEWGSSWSFGKPGVGVSHSLLLLPGVSMHRFPPLSQHLGISLCFWRVLRFPPPHTTCTDMLSGGRTSCHVALCVTHVCRTASSAHPESLAGAPQLLQHLACTSSLPGRPCCFCTSSHSTRVLLQPDCSTPGNSFLHHTAHAQRSQLTHRHAEKVLRICPALVLGWWEDAPGKAQLEGGSWAHSSFCSGEEPVQQLPLCFNSLSDGPCSVPRDVQREDTTL